MINGQLGSVVRYLRQVAAEPQGETRSDGQLLHHFVESGDDSAFALLVQRHGPMVLAVCQRVLHDPHAAEDAFQATFLILSRKARSIRKQESVGSWLHGVAYRIARKARSRASVQRDRETVLNDHPSAPVEPDAAWRELRPVLDEELSRLPEKYRAPLVLCYLEGKTNEAAARELGWTKGTVSGRLARARDLLRKRLQRRGLSLAPALLASLLCEQSAPAALAAPLLVATVKGVCGQAVADLGLCGTGKVISLAEGAMQTMFLTKSTIAIGLVLVLTAFSAGLAVMGYASSQQDPAQPAFLLSEQVGAAGEGMSDKELLQGTWIVVTARANGQDVDAMQGNKITFQGDKVKLGGPGGGGDGTYRLFPDKSPRRIDIILPDTEKGMGLGIYKLEDDKLYLCIDDYNNGRPTTFTSKAGTKHMSAVLQRVGGKAPSAKGGGAELQKLRAENELLKAQLEMLRFQMELLKQSLENEKHEQAVKKALQWLNQQKVDAATEKAKEQTMLALMALGQAQLKDAASKEVSMNNLKQIGLAFHCYADQAKRLPAANIYSKDGKPLLSWRVAILPYIEQDQLYQQFRLNEPWDSDHNKKLLAQMPKIYAPVGGKAKDQHSTFYQVFTGPKTLFDGSTGKEFIDIKDGTSNTVMAVEAGEAVPWTKPEDIPYQGGKPLPKLGGLFDGGFNLLLADGSVRFVPAGFDEDTLRHMITIADGQVVDHGKLMPAKKQ